MTGVAGIILAGGRSSRMGGGDKCLLPLASRPVLAHVIDRLAPQVGRLAINANDDPARFAAFGLQIVADTIPGHPGPLAGVLAGMKWATNHPGVTHVATVASDTPFFPHKLVAELAIALDDTDVPDRIVLACSGGRSHPVFGLWPIALAGDLKAYLEKGGSLKVRDYAGVHRPVTLVDFPLHRDRDPFFNINTPDDLAMAEALILEGFE